MKKNLFFLLILFTCSAYAQAPYIGSGSGEGVGQYGYLEKDAVSFFRLYRNTYSNIDHLAARVYVTNYANTLNSTTTYPTLYWNDCSTSGVPSLTTNNYATTDFGAAWDIGSSVYSSVYSYYCGGGCYCTNTGFNERTMQVLDFDNTPPTGQTTAYTSSTTGCTTAKLVGSFTIDVGLLSGKSFNRFFFQNTGTAQEGTNIANGAFSLYYEPATGSEIFNGTESKISLYGDYGGDATNNNIYGADNMAIPLSGKVRFYLVICNPPGGGLTINPSTVNDGLSILPTNNGFSMLRIAATSIGAITVLPILNTSFTTELKNNNAFINWQTNTTNLSSIEIEKSIDQIHFTKIATINNLNKTNFTDYYLVNGIQFYRLKFTNVDGSVSYSKTNTIDYINKNEPIVKLIDKRLLIENLSTNKSICIFNTTGQTVLKLSACKESENINIAQLAKGIYYVVINGEKVNTTKICIQ